jgi:hypothetical protein
VNRTTWALAVAAAVTVPAIGLMVTRHEPAGRAGAATHHELAGAFTLWADTPRADPCQPRPEAPDIHEGAPVDVRDDRGTTLAGAVLGKGAPDSTHRGCVYGFSVARVPAAAAYSVQVGARIGPTYTRTEVARANWRVALNLGLPDPTK